jgi:hypothetical protein
MGGFTGKLLFPTFRWGLERVGGPYDNFIFRTTIGKCLNRKKSEVY